MAPRLGLKQAVGGSKEASLAVYKDHLSGIDRDVEAGVLSAAEAEGQKAEIGRRILATAREADDTGTAAGRLPIVLGLLVPLVALPVYYVTGHPELGDVPHAQRLADAQKNNDLEAMVAKVEIHMDANPQDVTGWELLMPSYFNMGRYADAANAAGRLIELKGPTAELYSSLSEALTLDNGGMMNEAAIAAANEALKLDSKDPKARYYAALGLMQSGKKDEARAAFTSLLADSPADAPWRDTVQRELAKLEGGGAAPQISADQMKNMANMSPEQRMAVIRSMVDGLEQKLAANDKDVQGWLRLVRSRTMLNEKDKALAALDRARAALKDDQSGLAAIDALAKELNLQ
jgi:cytochrome c-type biogenesis protein CcmH